MRILERLRLLFGCFLPLICIGLLGVVAITTIFVEFDDFPYIWALSLGLLSTLVLAFFVGWLAQRKIGYTYTKRNIEVGVLDIDSGRLQLGDVLLRRPDNVVLDVPAGRYKVRATVRQYGGDYTECERVTITNGLVRDAEEPERTVIVFDGGPLVISDGTVTAEAAKREPLKGIVKAAQKRLSRGEEWGVISDEQGRNIIGWVQDPLGEADYPIEIVKGKNSRVKVIIRFLKKGGRGRIREAAPVPK